jgi:hypothetical protein
MEFAAGTFEVKLDGLEPYNQEAGAGIGRQSIEKRYAGDLEATGRGEMISAATRAKGSGAYVAFERVTGVLRGRRGSFTLQHCATLNRGVPQLTVTVVPQSGSGELAGLSGEMEILVADGVHSYEFDYEIVERE